MLDEIELTSRLIEHETNLPGRADLFLETFLGKWDRSASCINKGHWAQLDAVDFGRVQVVLLAGNPLYLELASLEQGRASNALAFSPAEWSAILVDPYLAKVEELRPGGSEEALIRSCEATVQ